MVAFRSTPDVCFIMFHQITREGLHTLHSSTHLMCCCKSSVSHKQKGSWEHRNDGNTALTHVNSSARGKSFPLSAERNHLLLDWETYSKNLMWVFCYVNYVNTPVLLKTSSTSFESTRWMKHHLPQTAVSTPRPEKSIWSPGFSTFSPFCITKL